MMFKMEKGSDYEFIHELCAIVKNSGIDKFRACQRE